MLRAKSKCSVCAQRVSVGINSAESMGSGGGPPWIAESAVLLSGVVTKLIQ